MVLSKVKQLTFQCSANGYTQSKPFASEGSGSYAATTILERDFKTGMTVSSQYQSFSIPVISVAAWVCYFHRSSVKYIICYYIIRFIQC